MKKQLTMIKVAGKAVSLAAASIMTATVALANDPVTQDQFDTLHGQVQTLFDANVNTNLDVAIAQGTAEQAVNQATHAQETADEAAADADAALNGSSTTEYVVDWSLFYANQAAGMNAQDALAAARVAITTEIRGTIQLDADLATAEETLVELQSQINDAVEARDSAINAAVAAEAQARVDALATIRTDLQTAIAAGQAANTVHTNDISSNAQQIASNLDAIVTLEGDRDAHETRITAAEEAIVALQEAVEAAQSAVVNNITNTTTNVTNVTEVTEVVETTVVVEYDASELETSLAEQVAAIAALQASLETQLAAAAEATAAAQQAAQDYATQALEAEAAAIRADIEGATEHRAEIAMNLQSEVDARIAQGERLQDAVEDAVESIQSNFDAISVNSEAIQTNSDAIQVLEGRVDVLEDRVDVLEDRVDNHEDRISALENAAAAAQNDRDPAGDAWAKVKMLQLKAEKAGEPRFIITSEGKVLDVFEINGAHYGGSTGIRYTVNKDYYQMMGWNSSWIDS